MNKKRSYGFQAGTSSILIIIVILALVCFAGLSIVSATADYKLSSRLADRTTSYYEAVSLANEDFSVVYQNFLDIYRSTDSREAYFAKIKESYADSLTFSYPISDTQALVACISPVYPASETGNLFQITKFQVETVEDLELDNSLPVLFSD
jgi:hypothetical protein